MRDLATGFFPSRTRNSLRHARPSPGPNPGRRSTSFRAPSGWSGSPQVCIFTATGRRFWPNSGLPPCDAKKTNGGEPGGFAARLWRLRPGAAWCGVVSTASGGRCRSETGAPFTPATWSGLGRCSFDRLSAVDAGQRPALHWRLRAGAAWGGAVSTASRRSMPVGDRRSIGAPLRWDSTAEETDGVEPGGFDVGLTGGKV